MMLSNRPIRWVVKPRRPDQEARLASALQLPRVLAAILTARGLSDPGRARAFLEPSLEDLHDPFLLPDMDAACERVVIALRQGEPILVHGDYDADGITAAALLVRFLSKLDAQVQYFIPDRFEDSYGLSQRAVLASADEVGLIVAVDCGVRDHDAVDLAGTQNQDVIVVDHHEPGEVLPEPALVVNPKREDSRYPERELAAVGLAFKLASAICARLDMPQRYLERAFLDLVAIGTVADVAPLVGENRVMVAKGLQLLPNTRKLGLQVLMELCQVTAPVTARDVAFRIGPRLNAVGRMAEAVEALELLLGEDEVAMRTLALRLEGMNTERRKEQDSTFAEAMRLVEQQVDPSSDRVIVLAREGWHRGVVGIVAAKVLEETGLPTVLLAVEGEEARGSARSNEGFDIEHALGECEDLLLRYGGHKLAAGLELRAEYVDLLRQRLNEIGRALRPEGVPPTELWVDCQVSLDEVDEVLSEALERMEPCGEGNPESLMCACDVRVGDVRTVGANGKHLKLLVEDGQRRLDCIGFGMGDHRNWLRPGAVIDLCFTPKLDRFRGMPSLQLQLRDIRPAGQPS